jgi:hypothetical protein
MWVCASAACAALALAAAPVGCSTGPACYGVDCAARSLAACPRDSARGASGRCACADGDVLVLGACVPPAVGDAFCGRAAFQGSGGCAFRPCADGDALDVASGECVSRATLPHGGFIPCADGQLSIIEGGRAACVPSEATCPRGTTPSAGACARPLGCPPGTLPEASSCHAIVTTAGRVTGARVDVVDVGAWTELVLGVDGGRGSPYLCRPLQQRPSAFGLAPGQALTLGIRIALTFPDEDVSRVHADAQATDGKGRPQPPAVEALVSGAVGTLIEPLRGLGGEASAGLAVVRVRCDLGHGETSFEFEGNDATVRAASFCPTFRERRPRGQ